MAENQRVSTLDGPKEVHDVHRKFADGRGSFDTVMANLKRLKERHPEFYRNCRTNTVLSPEQDYQCMQEFFGTDEMISLLDSSVGLINEVGAREPISYDESLQIIQRAEIMKCYLNLLGELEGHYVTKLYKRTIDQLRINHRELRYSRVLGDRSHPGGPCIVGEKKTFVDIDGNLYACEKMIETPELRIGHLDTGFDVAQATKLQNIGATTAEECRKCWAFRMCTSCVAFSIDKDEIKPEARLRHCRQVRNAALSGLRDYMMMVEQGYDFEKEDVKEGGTLDD